MANRNKTTADVGSGGEGIAVGSGIEQKTDRTGDQQFNFSLGQEGNAYLTKLFMDLSILLHELKATVAAETRLQSQRIEVLEEEQKLQEKRLAMLERTTEREKGAILLDQRVGTALVLGLFTLASLLGAIVYLMAS